MRSITPIKEIILSMRGAGSGEAGPTQLLNCSKAGGKDPSAFGMAFDWLTGRGPDTYMFGQNSIHTINMMDAFRVNEARNYFYNIKYSGGIPADASVTDYRGAFGLIDYLWRAGFDTTEQFVGSYRIDIYRNGDNLDFVLNNTSSLQSFLYGLGPQYERDKFGPGGNMRQIFCWSEPLKK